MPIDTKGKIKLSVYVRLEQVKKIEALARLFRTSKNEIVRAALDHGLPLVERETPPGSTDG